MIYTLSLHDALPIYTHKYDPIAQREYYGLYSFFNNLNESVMDGNKPNPDPFIQLPSPEQKARQQELTRVIAEGQKKIDEPREDLDPAQRAWQAEWHRKLDSDWTTLELAEAKSSSTNG